MAHLRFQTMFPEKFQIDRWIRGDDFLHRRLRANDEQKSTDEKGVTTQKGDLLKGFTNGLETT